MRTATTPSASRAAATSIAVILAWAYGLRTTIMWTVPDRRHVVDERPAAGEERLVLPALDRGADVRRPLLRRAHDALAAACDGHDDVVVPGAAAEVALEPFADRGLARRLAVVDQRDGRHDHPRRAVPALERVVVVEGLLHGVQLPVRREALDRRDLGAVGLDAEHRAGLHRLAVERARCRLHTMTCRSRRSSRSGAAARVGHRRATHAARARARAHAVDSQRHVSHRDGLPSSSQPPVQPTTSLSRIRRRAYAPRS